MHAASCELCVVRVGGCMCTHGPAVRTEGSQPCIAYIGGRAPRAAHQPASSEVTGGYPKSKAMALVPLHPIFSESLDC